MTHYIRYYEDQIGGGGGGIRNVFAGSRYQRGRGIGAWLGGLFRRILPYVTSGAKAVGKEAVRAGFRIADDVAHNGASFKEALKSRAKESKKNLKRKAAEKISSMMKGDGYKRKRRKRGAQSRKKRASVRTGKVKKRTTARRRRRRKPTTSKKKKTTLRNINDIFGPK